jgi:hypothetical protein
MTTSIEWTDAFAQLLGVAVPSEEDVETILALAGCAAHASQRTAAPVACWMAARSSRSLGEALELAQALIIADDHLDQ